MLIVVFLNIVQKIFGTVADAEEISKFGLHPIEGDRALKTILASLQVSIQHICNGNLLSLYELLVVSYDILTLDIETPSKIQVFIRLNLKVLNLSRIIEDDWLLFLDDTCWRFISRDDLKIFMS